MKLDFVIIGGQKCGSTYLHTVISRHPEIAMINDECPHFESPDFENGGLEKLNDLLQKLPQNKIIGIKRPSYLCLSDVASRINEVNKMMKIIVILRNPLERLKSAYFHNMNYGFSPILSLNEGMDKLLSGELAQSYPRTKELLEFGFYGKYLKTYFGLFRDNVLVFTHDDLKRDKLQVIKTCYSFLGVDNSFLPLEELSGRPQEVNYSLLRTWVLTARNKHRFTYNSKNTRLFVKEQTAWDKFVCQSINLFDHYVLGWLNSSSNKPGYSEKNKKRLLEIYLSDVELLESLISRDITSWKSV